LGDAPEILIEGGDTTINGGSFILAAGGLLNFENDTVVAGGSFSTSGVEPGSGLVGFLGPTDWQGTVFLNGRSRVNSLAVVSAATTINSDQIDMDGTGGVTQWDVNAALTVNAAQIDTATNSFDVGGGAGNRITLNLANPTDAWQMMGTMELSGGPGVFYTRVAGSPMEVGGDLNIANSNVDITSAVTLLAGSEVDFAAATSDLRLSGASTIEAGANFTGQGLLHNNSSARGLTIVDGVSLGQAGLVNGGRLSLGDDGPGQVFVDRFVSESDATLIASIRGTTPGSELSHLLVTGGLAILDGTLALSLAEEDGFFAPEAGDQFTILTSPGGIAGEFDSLIQPVGMPTGLLFEVEYTANSVVLYVDTTYDADFDRDGDVDGNDLAVWTEAFDNSGGGDATSDGVSDGSDFLVWQRQLGLGLPVIMASSIPEPTTLVHGILGILGLCQFSAMRVLNRGKPFHR
jgi:hypothetical protein